MVPFLIIMVVYFSITIYSNRHQKYFFSSSKKVGSIFGGNRIFFVILERNQKTTSLNVVKTDFEAVFSTWLDDLTYIHNLLPIPIGNIYSV